MTDDTVSPDAQKAAKPLLRVVSGNPTDEDLAVLVTVFAGASGGGSAEPGPQIRDDWGHPLDRLRPVWYSPTGFSNQRW